MSGKNKDGVRMRGWFRFCFYVRVRMRVGGAYP